MRIHNFIIFINIIQFVSYGTEFTTTDTQFALYIYTIIYINTYEAVRVEYYIYILVYTPQPLTSQMNLISFLIDRKKVNNTY